MKNKIAYCSCGIVDNKHHTKLHVTEDNNGECTYCGYYVTYTHTKELYVFSIKELERQLLIERES